MGLFSFGKRAETFLVFVTSEGPGRLRINGVRLKEKGPKQAAIAHERTVCWVEFAQDGVPTDQGAGRAARQAENLLKELPRHATCRIVLDRLREGQDSVGKWLQLAEPAAKR